MGELLGSLKISLEYQQGWPEDSNLLESLLSNREKDIKSGFTHYGVHRDNIQIMSDGVPATQVLSRGQAKSLCLALLLAALSIIQQILDEHMGELLGSLKISLEYQQGWPEDSNLLESLLSNREKDIKSGFTHYGVHRDNIQIMSDGVPATQVLSRGQAKSLCLALLLAALKLAREKGERPMILLIDDLSSELDETVQNKLFQQLYDLEIQLFIANIKRVVPPVFQGKEFKLFHVEHGIITRLKND